MSLLIRRIESICIFQKPRILRFILFIFRLIGFPSFSCLADRIVMSRQMTATATARETVASMATPETVPVAVFHELLGQRLLEHGAGGDNAIDSCIATREIEGKAVGLFFA